MPLIEGVEATILLSPCAANHYTYYFIVKVCTCVHVFAESRVCVRWVDICQPHSIHAGTARALVVETAITEVGRGRRTAGIELSSGKGMSTEYTCRWSYEQSREYEMESWLKALRIHTTVKCVFHMYS